jgi:hypothetical protein
MSGTVHYRRIAHPQLFDAIGGPAILRYRPGRLVILADAREFTADPEFIHALNTFSNQRIARYHQHDQPQPGAGGLCLINRVRHLPGGRLIAIDIVDRTAHIEVVRTGMSDDFAAALAAAAMGVSRYLTPR